MYLGVNVTKSVHQNVTIRQIDQSIFAKCNPYTELYDLAQIKK